MAISAFGKEGIKKLVEEDTYILSLLMRRAQDNPKAALVISRVLMLAQQIACRFPPEVVVNKITPQWLKEKGLERHPELVKALEECGEAGEAWLENQTQEIVLFLIRAVQWDGRKWVATDEWKRLQEEAQ